MKKRFFCILTAITFILTCGCSKFASEELYNFEVVTEPFESMEILPSYTTHKTYADEQELFDSSEMVFIGMPLETFTDGTEHYYNYNLEEIDKNSEEKMFYYCTVRDIKVIEMIKGDKTLKTVPVADEAVVKTGEDGVDRIIGLPSNNTIAKKNVKYVYYVQETIPDNMDFYLTSYDQGLINIDGLDSLKAISSIRFSEVNNRFSTQFVKYNRTSVLK